MQVYRLPLGFTCGFASATNSSAAMGSRRKVLFVQSRALKLIIRPARVCVDPRRSAKVRMEANIGRVSLITGGCLLTGLLGNRLVLTPLDGLTATQSRADLLGVAASAVLILFGLARTEVSERRARVEMGGLDVAVGFQGPLGAIVEQGSRSLLEGVEGVKSVAVMVKGEGRFFLGKFREQNPVAILRQEGIISNALKTGNRAYLADMKVVPVRETEFGFFPKECQSVLVQPVSEDICVIVGADRPRPFTGQDFGWVQAVSDRIGASLLDRGLQIGGVKK